MGFHAAVYSVKRGLGVFEETKLMKTFINVNRQEYFALYFCILMFKGFTVAYGMKKIPETATLAMLFLNLIKSCICEIGFHRIFFAVSHFCITTTALFICHDEAFHPVSKAMVLMVACLYNSFEYFVDFYVVVLFFWYIFNMYGREINKSFALIISLYCLDWLTNYLLAGGSIGMIHAVILLHLPPALLIFLRPFNAETQYKFLYLVIGVLLWQIYRLTEAGFRKGVTTNRFFILNETINTFRSPRESLRKIPIFEEL